MTEERRKQIKQEWAEAVGADPDSLDDWPVDRIIELEHYAKAAAYYKSAVVQRRDASQIPPYVPCRVRLEYRITGDWPMHHLAAAGPGEMPCTANMYGAVSVLANNGKQLGLKLDEFEPIEWAENPAAAGSA